MAKGLLCLFMHTQFSHDMRNYLIVNAKELQNFRKSDLDAVEEKPPPWWPRTGVVHIRSEQRQQIPVDSFVEDRERILQPHTAVGQFAREGKTSSRHDF